MIDYKELERRAKECGFTHAVPLSVPTLVLMEEVRQMCEQNTCGQYGKNWCCPPGVGTLEQCRETLSRYREGILVQTVGELEDSLDAEGMMETQVAHQRNFELLKAQLQEEYPEMLSLGAGTCTRCKQCTYPDAPCRFPEETFASMEAYGILVTQACEKNGVPYYYGSNTIAYTSCFLLE